MLKYLFDLDEEINRKTYWGVIQNSVIAYTGVYFTVSESKKAEFYQKYHKLHFTSFPKSELSKIPTDDLMYLEKTLSVNFWTYPAIIAVHAIYFGGLAFLGKNYGMRSASILRIKQKTKANLFKYGFLKRHYFGIYRLSFLFSNDLCCFLCL